MKVFVTVGHTRFDSLFERVESIERPDWQFICQIYDGLIRPKNAECFEFVSHIHEYYRNADVVITHAGAGTVYSLLEMGKPTIVVANTDRLDPHQEDLLSYVENNGFAQVCRDLGRLEELLDMCSTFEATKYSTVPFKAVNEIARKLGIA